jgi:molybdopterin/thiamine biosynthesis adenylyltransferase
MRSILGFLDARKQGALLGWKDQVEAATHFSLDTRTVELIALQNGLLPARYQRNRQMISTAGQLKLFRSNVAVVGCGGLGGHILEQLARLGVGKIVIIDPDVFEESNLNRQSLSSPRNLGRAKVDVARERINELNPSVDATVFPHRLTMANGHGMLQGTQIVIDASDNIPARLELAELCESMNLPLVHGAVAGWYGHISTQFPGERSIQSIYGNRSEESGVEWKLGIPAFASAVVASLEVAETCKIILGEGHLVRGRQLCIDLLDMEFTEVEL